MRKHYSKTALCITSLFTIVTGCRWEETEYNKYVSDNGTLELCPNENQSGELLFIEVSANLEEQTDPDATNQNIIRCAQTCDGPIADCVPMTDLRCINYLGSFEHKLCPKNTLCLPWQDDTDKLYCGKPIIECRTVEDCKVMEGWVTGDCIDDKCVAQTCDVNYHITANGKCEIDSIEHCGEKSIKCADLKTEMHVQTFKCEDQTCKPIECEIGYHLSEDTQNTCEIDDENSCGGITCSQSNAGWSDGKCKMILNKPQCNATQCQEGYHLTLKTAQNTNDEDIDTKPNDEDIDTNPNDENIDTNEMYYLCEIDDDDHCGGARTINDLNTNKSENCKTKFKENGVELYYCKKVEDQTGHIKSSCDIAKCANNHHWNRTNTGCEKNDAMHCGSFNNDCSKIIPGSEPDKLVCSNDFQCYTTKCKTNYFEIHENSSIKIEGINDKVYSDCMLYTNTTCGLNEDGEKPKDCLSSNELCTNNDNTYSCQNTCGTDMTLCTDYLNPYCANLKTDILNCGECGKVCETGGPYTQPVCQPSQEDTSKDACAIQCLPGFIDCNENNEDGCEVNLFALNMSACETCTEGYANCDNDWSNGCEIKLDDYGLKSCKECTNDYTNCGLINNNTVALCLQEGHETWSWSVGNKTYTTDWGWGRSLSTNKDGEEDVSLGYVISWDYINKTDHSDHICQYLCNVDYGLTLPRHTKIIHGNEKECYQYNNSSVFHVLHYECNDQDISSGYWIGSLSTCQPKQKCYLRHGTQSFNIHCGD